MLNLVIRNSSGMMSLNESVGCDRYTHNKIGGHWTEFVIKLIRCCQGQYGG